MNFTAFTIKKTRIALSAFVIIALTGFGMFQNLAQDSMPPYTVRVATVVSQFEGASPERVELLVTDQVEKRIQEVPEVKEITSQSRTGLSIVTITLKNSVTPDKLQGIWDLIRRKLNNTQLPDGVKARLNDDGIGDVYGIMVGLQSDGFAFDEMYDYAENIRDVFIKLSDAAKVEISGAQEEQIFIDFDNAQLSRYGLSSQSLQNVIATTNIIFSGGEINQGSERIILEPTGNYNEIEDLKQTIIPTGSSDGVLYLGDITSIYKGYASPVTSMVRVNGNPALALSISLKEGANIGKLGEAVDAKIAELQSTLPVGLELGRLSSLDGFVSSEVDNFVSNLIQSILIVLIVMLLFLGLRSGLVIASLIPMVTLATLMFMGFISMGLNQVTLAGLIMALGMMVDNAVVVAESIMVKMEEGLSRYEAAVQSCDELFTPLLISTLTTSAAFLSFYLAQSTMGDIVGPLFVVISSALLFSWLFSLTLVAFLSYQFIQIGDREYHGAFGVLERLFDAVSRLVDRLIIAMRKGYRKLILWGLHHRILVIVGVFALFFASLFGFSVVPFLFFPDSERNLITVDINLSQGTRIDYTSDVVQGIEDFLTDHLKVSDGSTAGVLDWSAYIGEGPESYDQGYTPDEPNTNYAHILVNTSSGDDNAYVIQQIDSFAFNTFPEADIKVGRLGSGGGGTPIEVLVKGDDPDILYAISDEIKAQLKTIAGTKNVKDDWGPKIKKIKIDIDPTRSRSAGLTNQDIAISLQTGLSGYRTGNFRKGKDNFPIIMRNAAGEEMDIGTLEGLNVYAQQSGRSVPLTQVASIVPEWQLAKIKRKDLFRTMTVSSEIGEEANASVIMSQLTPWLTEAAQNWPDGYTYELGGEDKNTADNMGPVIAMLPLSGIIILLLLIIQFNSIRKTAMVLMTIPLGIIGVVIGLITLRTYFGFMAFLGIISLAGIIINNAIVLLDRIDIEETLAGTKSKEVIVTACVQRFRPIILTTFTTVLGLIPLYLGGGIMWEPMAASIMVGLLFGTIITLLFIPVMYSLLFRVR